jgi:hypothetical protein
MGWHEVMQELESKLEGTLRGTYRPLDNVPFFRVQYPPSEERQALGQFRLFAERLRQRKWKVNSVSLTEVLRHALASLLNCQISELHEHLRALEEQDRAKLQTQLSDYLPVEVVRVLKEHLKEMPRESVAVLLRMGGLVPFIRSSSLESKLEGEISCAVVLPYPGTTLGALLDAPSADQRGGYYRGEVIAWR